MDFDRKRVAVVTGPTGGHFFPGLAIGERLSEVYGFSVTFFVPRRDYILYWIKRKECKYALVPEVKLRIKDPFFLFRFAFSLLKAVFFLLKGHFGGVVLTGSYSTAPFLLAARILGIKILVHEQNYLPGKVTLLSRRIADKIAVTYPNLSELPLRKTVVTGFPVLHEFKAQKDRSKLLESFGLCGQYKTVLVIGGSQGAHSINRLIVENLQCFRHKNLQFIHIAGDQQAFVRGHYVKNSIKAHVLDFHYDMADIYNVADFAVCRGGGGTLAEINRWCIPSLIIPYPYAGLHQKHNVSFFEKAGACMLIEQENATPESFPRIFDLLLARGDEIKENLKKISIVDDEGKTAGLLAEMVEN